MDLEGQTEGTGHDLITINSSIQCIFFERLGCSNSCSNAAEFLPSWNSHSVGFGIRGVTSGLLGPKLEWPFSLEYLPSLTSLSPQCTVS